MKNEESVRINGLRLPASTIDKLKRRSIDCRSEAEVIEILSEIIVFQDNLLLDYEEKLGKV